MPRSSAVILWRDLQPFKVAREADAGKPAHPQRGPNAAVEKDGHVVQHGKGVHAQARNALDEESNENNVAQNGVGRAGPGVVGSHLAAEATVRVRL